MIGSFSRGLYKSVKQNLHPAATLTTSTDRLVPPGPPSEMAGVGVRRRQKHADFAPWRDERTAASGCSVDYSLRLTPIRSRAAARPRCRVRRIPASPDLPTPTDPDRPIPVERHARLADPRNPRKPQRRRNISYRSAYHRHCTSRRPPRAAFRAPRAARRSTSRHPQEHLDLGSEHLAPPAGARRSGFRAPRAARRSTSIRVPSTSRRPQEHLAPPSEHLAPPSEHLAPPSEHLAPPAGAPHPTPPQPTSAAARAPPRTFAPTAPSSTRSPPVKPGWRS
jgi:hypothetical protein